MYIIAGFSVIALVCIIGGYTYHSNPFRYPCFTINFDISGKRQPIYENYIDEWIIDLHVNHEGAKARFEMALHSWEYTCEYYLARCVLWKSHRIRMLESMKHDIYQYDRKIFRFVFNRDQTRYSQVDYQKSSYTVANTENIVEFSLREMLKIDTELEKIGYETTRSKWYSNNQRRLLTKDLRTLIKERDNYTCQICGKYMPDEVGLHIDHIVPINKGGRSVESNLQVLCDKCNLSKGRKII